MKTYYHGTVSSFAPMIAKEGLRFVESNMWNATKPGGTWNPKYKDPHGFIHMAPGAGYAAEYAEAKARFYQTAPGERFMAVNGVVLVKAQDAAHIPDAQARVYVVSLLEKDLSKLYLDMAASSGVQFEGDIPASRVKQIGLETAKTLTVPADLQKIQMNAIYRGLFADNDTKVRMYDYSRSY